MNGVRNILLAGVGGQGTILAGKILSEGLAEAGFDVKMSEIHGMSQRGGNVSTQIRYGDKVFSPVIARHEADVIAAFEKMEALRWIEYLRPDGKLIANDFEIYPAPVLMGAAKYPEGILEELSAKADVLAFRADEIAKEIGNRKSANMVLLGALVQTMGIGGVPWDEVIRENVRADYFEVNIKAFEEGKKRANA